MEESPDNELIYFNIDDAMSYALEIAVVGDSYYDFVIDWQRKEILLRNRDPGHRLKKSFGFGYGLEENELKVMFVFDNSPASNAGITAGTQILEIYGKDVEELSLEGYCSIRNFNFEEETIFLRIKKGDSSREVKLAKEYLFK